MADDKKTAEEFKGLTKATVEGFKNLTASIKARAEADAAELAKNTDAVKESRKEQMSIRQQLINNGTDAAEANAQTRAETVKIMQQQKDAIIKNNPALTILAPLKMMADGAKAGVKSAAAQVEDKRKNFRLQESLLNGINSVEQGVLGVASTFGNAVKEKASAFGGGLKGILSKLLIGGALAAFVAFMNSPYWEKMKTLISEKIVPALTFVFDNILKPLWDEGLSLIFKQFETIGNLFSGIGDAITLFKEGKILEGISTLVGSLGTFFKDTVDNLITGVYNLFGGLFGLEKTDSVFGEISKFFSDTWTSIKTFFTDLYNGVVGIFTDPVGTLTNLWNGLVGGGGLIDILFYPVDKAIAWVKGLFGWGDPDEPFSLTEFVQGAFKQVKDWVVGLFTWGAEAGETEAGDFSITKLGLEAFKKVKEWVTGLFSWADSTKPEGEDAEWTLLGSILEAVKAPIRFLRDLFTFETDFFEKSLLSQLGIASAKLVDLVFYPLNLAVNFVKGLFGWDEDADGNKTTFSVSGLIGELLGKVGDFFKSLFDIDVRAMAKSFLPDTVVDFLFGKEVDQNSEEFKNMDSLEQAKATGLYDHDTIGASEINRNLVQNATDAQLQAILDHKDLREEDVDFIKKEQAKRVDAGEFSNVRTKQYLLPEEARQGAYSYRGSKEYEDLLMAAPYNRMRKNVKWADMRYKSNNTPKTGQKLDQASIDAKTAGVGTTVVIAGQAKDFGGQSAKSDMVAMPVPTRDNSSSAAALAANSN